MKAKVFFCGLVLGAVLFSRYDGNFLFDIWLAVRPIFVGMLIAVFLWPISCFLEKKLPFKKESLRRSGGLLLLGGGILLLASLCVSMLAPAVKNSFFSVYSLISDSLAEYEQRYPVVFSLIQKAARYFDGQGLLQEKLTETAGSFMDVLTGAAVAFLILYHRRAIALRGSRLMKRILGRRAAEKVQEAVKTAVKVFGSFFLGQLTEALVIGTGCLLFTLTFSIPYGVEISLLVAITAVIPVAGAIVGTAAGVLVILSRSFQQAAVFLLFMVLLQWLENLLIYPRVVGKTVGLSTVGTLTAVILGGKLFGAGGVLFFVPLAGTLKRLVSLFWPEEELLRENPGTKE